MNLKFFLLGLCVLVSIVQVRTQVNGIQDEKMNGKPDQFHLMELINSHRKRNILSDLLVLNADDGKTVDRDRRQEVLPVNGAAAAAAVPAAATAKSPKAAKTTTPVATTVRTEAIPGGRRFNPLEMIGNVAKMPVEIALKQAMSKLFSSYTDTSKPFGPTYDTTWGSPGDAQYGRRMEVGDQQQPPADEVRMSTMIQPPQGHSGYYTYSTHKKPIITKTYSSYADSSKPFGSNYDTTWGSSGDAQNAGDKQQPPNEVRMSTMIQPPPGQAGYYTYSTQKRPMVPKLYSSHDTTWTSSGDAQNAGDKQQPPVDEVRMSTMIQPPQGQSGYYTYSTQKKPTIFRSQEYGPSYRSTVHSLEPSLPYEANYDKYMNGKQTVFSVPPPGYFPYYPFDHQTPEHPYFQQQHRRKEPSNSDEFEKRMYEVMNNSPEEITKLMEEIQTMLNENQGTGDASARKAFLGNSKGKSSGEVYSDTQVEFNGPNSDVMIGSRRFAETQLQKDFHDKLDKIVAGTAKGLVLILGYLGSIIEKGNSEQIGDTVLQMYEVLKDVKSYYESF